MIWSTLPWLPWLPWLPCLLHFVKGPGSNTWPPAFAQHPPCPGRILAQFPPLSTGQLHHIHLKLTTVFIQNPFQKKSVCIYIYINNIYNIHQTITITTFQTADTEKNTIARSTGGGRQARVPSTSRAHEFFAHGKAMLHDAAPLSKGKISLEMMKPNREIFADWWQLCHDLCRRCSSPKQEKWLEVLQTRLFAPKNHFLETADCSVLGVPPKDASM